MKTREEHLAWCKKRAKEYLENGDIQNAVASMLSDLGKHPETTHHLSLAGMLGLAVKTSVECLAFIEGFA